MALSPKDAVTAVQQIIIGARAFEATRLDRIHKALKPCTPTVEIPRDAPDVMKQLAAKSQTNFLPRIVDTFAQGMQVVGYQASGSSDNAAPWQWWQSNGMDARQAGVHRTTLEYGVAYVTVLPGRRGAENTPEPKLSRKSPRQMTALYQDPSEDEWPMMALEIDGSMMRLYDEEQVYWIGSNNPPRSSFQNDVAYWTSGMAFIEARAHGQGVCPVVRFRDRMLLDGEEQYGIVEPLLTIQQRIDETTFGMLVAQFYQAFRQRWIVGWVPQSEEEELRAGASQMWTFENDSVRVGDFAASDLTAYIESKSSAVRDIAAIAQVPAQNLGVDGVSNISAEALAGLEAGKDRKSDEITTSLGESWEQVLRQAALVAGDEAAANDFSAQVRWKDGTARSLAQTVDALGKMVQMLGIPPQGVWGRVPGVTDQDIETWKSLAAENDSLGQLAATLMTQATPADGIDS